MIQVQLAQNPLFLRDAELERSLALLTLLQLELEAVAAPVLERLDLETADTVLLGRITQCARQGLQVSAADLVAYLGWSKQRVSRRLGSLIALGLIERRPSPLDRRRKYIRPTAIGNQQMDELQSLQKRHLRRIFRRAGPAEVAGFQNVLAVAAQHVGRGRQAALPMTGQAGQPPGQSGRKLAEDRQEPASGRRSADGPADAPARSDGGR